MPGKYLLDTNIIIGILNGDPDIAVWLTKNSSIFIPVIAVAELYFGAYKSSRAKENIKILEVFFSAVPILHCDSTTAKEYGIIKADLKKRGEPVPENDVWIAAITRQHGLILATADTHFKNIRLINAEYFKIK